MSIFNSNYLSQSLVVAGSLSLYSGLAQAQPAPTEVPHGRAGTATLCIEKRSYVDVNTKTIVTPAIYLNEIPAEGIDTGYVPGNRVAQEWDKLLKPTDTAKKEWLKEAEDLPNQFNDAVDLVKKFDKNKDGIVSKEEFDAGEKGATEADKRTDIGLLTALACSGKYLTEGALNKVDLNKFPEVTDLKNNNALLQAKLDVTTSSLTAAQNEMHDQYKLMMVLAGVSAVTSIGMIVSMVRHRRHRKKTEGTPPPKTPATPPPLPAPTETATPVEAAAPANREVATRTGAVVPAAGYDDVLGHLNDGEEPNKNVLAALEDGESGAGTEGEVPAGEAPAPEAPKA